MTINQESPVYVVGSDGKAVHVLYLHSAAANPIKLALRDVPGRSIKISNRSIKLSVHTGLLLSDAELAVIAKATYPGFQVESAGSGEIRFSRTAIDAASLELPLPAVILRGKPYGTILFRLIEGQKTIAITEVDVLPDPTSSEHASQVLPVKVEWDASNHALDPHSKSDLVLTIANERTISDKAAAWVDPRPAGALTPRIRIALPEPGRAPLFASELDLREIQVLLRSHAADWSVREGARPSIRELVPGPANDTLLPAGGALTVIFKNLRPRASGTWSIDVAFINFPGYFDRTITMGLTTTLTPAS